MKNAKGKGNRGELQVCKILNTRFNTNQFGRVPSSGGISTFRKGALSAEAEKTLSGDVFSPAGFIWALEIKTGYDLEFNYFLNEKPSADFNMLRDFCFQSSRDAKRVEGRIPMVIYNKDRRDPVCVLPLNNHSRSEILKEILEKKLNKYIYIDITITDFPEWDKWIIVSMTDLLKMENDFFFEKEI